MRTAGQRFLILSRRSKGFLQWERHGHIPAQTDTIGIDGRSGSMV